MACEQMRQEMESLRILADKSTGEDKRCVVEKVKEVRKATVGLRKKARGVAACGRVGRRFAEIGGEKATVER